VSEFDLKSKSVKNYKFSNESDEIEKRIYEARNNKFDIFENKENFIIYKVENLEKRKPDLSDAQTKKEISDLVTQKNKFDYNRKLLEQIKNEKFTEDDFLKFGKEKIQSLTLNSIKDNNKFEINSVELLYSLPMKSFTLINDENNNIFIAKIKDYDDVKLKLNTDNYDQFFNKENTRTKNNILKSYDLFLNEKYNVNINQVAIDNIKNLFQ